MICLIDMMVMTMIMVVMTMTFLTKQTTGTMEQWNWKSSNRKMMIVRQKGKLC